MEVMEDSLEGTQVRLVDDGFGCRVFIGLEFPRGEEQGGEISPPKQKTWNIVRCSNEDIAST
jgi:hypothetical protein